MNIIKTTDYFNMTVEEAGKIIDGDLTKEEAKVLDSGLEHTFFETLEGLETDYNSNWCKEYVKKTIMKYYCLSLSQTIAIIINIVWCSNKAEFHQYARKKLK